MTRMLLTASSIRRMCSVTNTRETLLLIDQLVRSSATYVPDPKLRDSWDSYAQQVMHGERFMGDCDDWAMTALEIARVYYDVPADKLYRCMVSTTGQEIDHMVGLMELTDGSRWTLGDTFGPPKLASSLDIRQSSRMDERRGGLPLWRFWGKPQVRRTTNTAAAGMKISPKGIAFIKGFEAFYPRVYDDFQPKKVLRVGDVVRGTLTIGYGHTGKDVKIGMPFWTEPHASQVLDTDLDVYEAAVRRLLRVNVTQNQFDALVSFCFNCGESNLASSTLLKKVNARAPTSEIQVQFRRWNRSKGVVMNGLVRRRDAEAAMWAGLQFVTNATPSPVDVEVSPSPLVEEVKRPLHSVTLWLTGALAAMPLVVEAARGLREIGVEVQMPLVINITGGIMIAASVAVFAKRMYEIAVQAKR